MEDGIPAVLMRGGTSRGLLFHESDLAHLDQAERWDLFASSVGSPDPGGRQVDGTGGGNATTSKVVVIAPWDGPDADISYDFFQIDVSSGRADHRTTCGNLTAAAATFARDENLVPADSSTVRMWNPNLQRMIVAEFLDRRGQPPYQLAGTPRPLPPIAVRFVNPGGAVTGSIHPTGAPSTIVQTSAGWVEVSVVDVVSPIVLVRPESLGVENWLDVDALERDSRTMTLLQEIRQSVAELIGLTASPVAPFVGLIGAGGGTAGSTVPIRMLSGGQVHRALPLGAGLSAAAAVVLSGTVAGTGSHVPAPDSPSDGPRIRTIELEHPSGILPVEVTTTADGAVAEVAVVLTARRIMAGEIYRYA